VSLRRVNGREEGGGEKAPTGREGEGKEGQPKILPPCFTNAANVDLFRKKKGEKGIEKKGTQGPHKPSAPEVV